MTTQYLQSGKQERRNKICSGTHSAKGATSTQKPWVTPQAKGDAALLALNTAALEMD